MHFPIYFTSVLGILLSFSSKEYGCKIYLLELGWWLRIDYRWNVIVCALGLLLLRSCLVWISWWMISLLLLAVSSNTPHTISNKYASELLLYYSSSSYNKTKYNFSQIPAHTPAEDISCHSILLIKLTIVYSLNYIVLECNLYTVIMTVRYIVWGIICVSLCGFSEMLGAGCEGMW